MERREDIESQRIGLHARHGVPEPEFPDIQEPEPQLPQKRIALIYTLTRIFCGLLILTNTAMDWALYAELNSACEDKKKRFLAVTIIGTILTVAQIGNIAYQIKANYNEDYQFQEPLNYIDGRTEALLMVLLVELPQLLLLQDYSSSCEKRKLCSDTFTVDLNFLVAWAVVGLVGCHFRFHLSRPLPRFGRRGLEDEYKMLKLEKTGDLKFIICVDQLLPKILRFVGLDILCFCRKFKIPLVFGDCICDHLTPIWRWSYFVLECWICRFTYCPKRERGEVWFVNRMRMLRRRSGFLCLNKEDPYFLGVYFPYFFTMAVCAFLGLLGMYNCSIPFNEEMKGASGRFSKVYELIIFNNI